MELPWLRLYTEFAVDPQIQMLAFEDQRHYVMALCMKGRGMLDKDYASAEVRLKVICATLGLDRVACDEANRRLKEHGLVDEAWHPTAWEKRQFKTDHDTAERQRRSREKRAEVLTTMTASAGLSRDSHKTPRDSHVLDSDTDQIQKRKEAGARPTKRAAGSEPKKAEPDPDMVRRYWGSLISSAFECDLWLHLPQFRRMPIWKLPYTLRGYVESAAKDLVDRFVAEELQQGSDRKAAQEAMVLAVHLASKPIADAYTASLAQA